MEDITGTITEYENSLARVQKRIDILRLELKQAKAYSVRYEDVCRRIILLEAQCGNMRASIRDMREYEGSVKGD